jgi:hypothetical protein
MFPYLFVNIFSVNSPIRALGKFQVAQFTAELLDMEMNHIVVKSQGFAGVKIFAAGITAISPLLFMNRRNMGFQVRGASKFSRANMAREFFQLQVNTVNVFC